MSETLSSPVCLAPLPDGYRGAVRAICRALNGLTLADATDCIVYADMALAGELPAGTDDPTIRGILETLKPWGVDWGRDILESVQDTLLDGHHVNVHCGRMVWILEARDALGSPADTHQTGAPDFSRTPNYRRVRAKSSPQMEGRTGTHRRRALAGWVLFAGILGVLAAACYDTALRRAEPYEIAAREHRGLLAREEGW